MKNKKLLLVTLLAVGIFGLVAWWPLLASTSRGIDFKPNIKIPNTPFDAPVIEITNSSLGEYIVALYSYGSIFAGFVAMFMLVYAGWQWLMAAGRLDKISQAKNTISGVLIGLGLLFGSYVLMSQISERLVNFGSLNIQSIEVLPGMDQFCSQALTTRTGGCGETQLITKDEPGNNYGIDMICVFQACPSPNPNSTLTCVDLTTGSPCPSVVNSFDEKPPKCDCVPTNCLDLVITDCSGYKALDMCKNNACLNQAVSGGSIFTQTCIVDHGSCNKISDKRCSASRECDWDGTGTWCCEESRSWDYCRIDLSVDPNGNPGTNNCKDY